MDELDPFEGVTGLIFYATRGHDGYTFSMNMTSIGRVRSIKASGLHLSKVHVSWESSRAAPTSVDDFLAKLSDVQRDSLAQLLTGMSRKRRAVAGGLKVVEVIGGVNGPVLEFPEPTNA